MTTNIEHFKAKLEEEQARLEQELSRVARKNPTNPSEWIPMPNEHEGSQADENVVADAIEEYEDNAAIASALEKRLNDVRSGLDKMKHNVFGICQICKKEIEQDRLEANPAARTCKEHINSL
ncbi:TraR/DksA C4-type zinc finger protein [Candidatus Parcubacteria bacterium]|nr:TraR/DksA C4-type zinc finger protein [Candidatus Parcubacteria bacterium]